MNCSYFESSSEKLEIELLIELWIISGLNSILAKRLNLSSHTDLRYQKAPVQPFRLSVRYYWYVSLLQWAHSWMFQLQHISLASPANETALEPLWSPDHRKSFVSHYTSLPRRQRRRKADTLRSCSLLIWGEGVHSSAAGVYLRKKRRCSSGNQGYVGFSQKREIKETSGWTRNEEKQGSFSSVVLKFDPQLPEAPTVSPQGENQVLNGRDTWSWRKTCEKNKQTVLVQRCRAEWTIMLSF